MNSVPAPLDKEWQQAVAIVLEAQRFPAQNFTIGAGARTIAWLVSSYTGCGRAPGYGCQIAGMRGPADQTWFLKRGQASSPKLFAGRRARLLWIRSDDLQITQGPQCE